MKNVAIVFPGQGSQYVGMGSDLISEEIFNKRMEQVANALSISIGELFSMSTSDTNIMQPYIYGMSVALYEMWQEKYDSTPILVAGHSLGEVSALVASGSLSFEEGLYLVTNRGELMQHAPKGTMVAVIGIEEEVLQDTCEKISSQTGGTVKIGNFNSPLQYVITGDFDAVYKTKDIIIQNNLALKVKELNVSGAFHSKLMDDANLEFVKVLQDVSFQKPRVPIVMNVSGEAHSDVDDIKELFSKQMNSSVQWKITVETILERQPDLILEIGPGRTLTGIVKGMDRRQKIANIGNKQQLAQFAKLIRRLEVV